mgnify:CR=1 FL=1
MNESFQNIKTPEHLLYENVIGDNEKFLTELASAQSLDELKEIINEYTHVDGEHDHWIYAVGESDGESTDIQPHVPAELIKAIDIFKSDSPIDDLGVDEWMPHPDIARAIKRILSIE